MLAASLSRVSRLAHDTLFDGPTQSLCARAWEYRHTRAGWLWCIVFGKAHCKAAYLYWRRKG